MKPSGSIFYQDEFLQQYRVDWATVGDAIDFTSVVSTPYRWGQPKEGYLKNGILFRRGTITVSRLVLRPFVGGYEIIAEGVSQYEDDIRMNFPCGNGPADSFKFHLDRPFIDICEIVVTDGTRWADPDEANDVNMMWGDIDSFGNAVPVSGTPLGFIDVWSN